ncbi:MAG TPA: hypothetical protein ENK18_00980 [Deltaproteobacteria bacterium]|nr:hypothetical protein [Deltaproteobacteria bacterium]
MAEDRVPELLRCAAPVQGAFRAASELLVGPGPGLDHHWISISDPLGDSSSAPGGLPTFEERGIGTGDGYRLSDPLRPVWGLEGSGMYERPGTVCQAIEATSEQIAALLEGSLPGTPASADYLEGIYPILSGGYDHRRAALLPLLGYDLLTQQAQAMQTDPRVDFFQCQVAIDELLGSAGLSPRELE